MGLIARVLTFPVTGPWWVMERVVEEAERRLYDEDEIKGQLAELESLHEAGRLGEQELAEAEEQLLERLRIARGQSQAEA